MTIEWIKINNESDIQIKNDLRQFKSEIEEVTTEEVTIEDINKLTLSDAQWVSPEGVMKALNSLKRINPSLWGTISPLIKKWDILWIQLSLGMEVGAKNSNKNADGLFGRSTLNNLWAWKVVKTNLTPTPKRTRGDETIDLWSNVIRISNMDEVRKWWWSWETTFVYTPAPNFGLTFFANWRFIQKIDATEPQSILKRAAEGAEYTVDMIKWNWTYNENGQMVVTYDGKVEKNKRTEDDSEATTKFNQAIEKMSK